MQVIAHIGHWALPILYAVPVIVVLASVAVTLVRERRQRRDVGWPRESTSSI